MEGLLSTGPTPSICRTAPNTPGLLILIIVIFVQDMSLAAVCVRQSYMELGSSVHKPVSLSPQY